MADEKTIICERLIIRDTAGQVRCMIGMDDEQASVGLIMNSASGALRIGLTCCEQSGGFTLCDGDGNARVAVSIAANGDAGVELFAADKHKHLLAAWAGKDGELHVDHPAEVVREETPHGAAMLG